MIIDVSNLKFYFDKYNIKIKTDTGYENVINVIEKEEDILEFHFDNYEILKVADNHLFEVNDNEWKLAKDLQQGDFVLDENGKTEILTIIKHKKEKVYDLTIDSKKHQYYLNKISSHNTGKTTTIHSLLNELSADYKWINASENNSVQTIRNEIVDFASTMSVSGNKKILVLDEADNLTTSTSTGAGAQDILRGVIEQYAGNTRFFLTGNYKERFIDALVSRFRVFDFDVIFTKHRKELAGQMYKRLMFICDNEKVKYDKKDLQQIVKEQYPSMRNMVILLQNNIFNNELKLQNTSIDEEFVKIMEYVKDKNFTATRSELLILNNPSSFYTWLWKKLDDYIEPNKQPNIIIELARYQEMDKTSRNKEITLMAFLTKLMSI